MDVNPAVVPYSLSSKTISSSQARDLYPCTVVSTATDSSCSSHTMLNPFSKRDQQDITPRHYRQQPSSFLMVNHMWLISHWPVGSISYAMSTCHSYCVFYQLLT